MHSQFLLAGLAAFFTIASAAPTELQGWQCGSPEPSTDLLTRVRDLDSIALDSEALQAALVIDTWLHVVTSPGNAGPTRDQLSRQIAKLNAGYSSVSVSFRLAGISRTTNAAWASGQDELEMKSSLRRGTYATLNHYFVEDIGDGILGFCYFPEPNAPRGSEFFIRDGCVNVAGSVPGGTIPGYTLGATAVHETGHWFGLFHTFQGESCQGSGDGIADTPLQISPTFGCPSRRDSCPNSAGLDPITNYMDYTNDSCKTGFTPGQGTRINRVWSSFRAGK